MLDGKPFADDHRVIARGVRAAAGRLVVREGANWFRAAVRDVFGDVPVQWCQSPMRENVVRHLPNGPQALWRSKRHTAYARATSPTATRARQTLVQAFATLHVSAARRLDEGLEETLTLHRLAVMMFHMSHAGGCRSHPLLNHHGDNK